MTTATKPVVYVVVDGMSTTAFEQATASGVAPAFAFLKERSSYVRDGVAIFPTITPAATATLVTGELPVRHGIPGMCWYDRDAQRYVNYGQSPRAAMVEGVSQIVRDVLENLNSKHLNPKVRTIHEQLHDLGIPTGSINFMVFRGPYEHRLQPNKLERLLFRKHLPETMPGPKEHYWADVVNGTGRDCTKGLPKRGLDKRIEATDGWAACVTRDILTHDAARMVLFYLHENDHRSHRKGPDSQVDNLAVADKHLAYVLDTFGPWEETIDRVGFVVTSDHSQSPISSEDDHIVDLCDALDGFSCVEPARGKEPFGRRDLAVCGNGRVGFIYLNEGRRDRLRDRVVAVLQQHEAIDQIMWRDEDAYVVSSPRGDLRFWVADGDGVVDERDNKWAFEGDLDAVTGVVEGKDLRTPEYPLAFWRIKGALDLDRMGDIVVTPRLTYEFTDLAGGHHKGGGDHASLHVQDSMIPFMSTLADAPLHPTTVDVVPHIVSHFKQA